MQLEKDIGTLKMNREKVGDALLRTKYRKPYGELLEKIRGELEDVLFGFVFGQFPAAAGDEKDERFIRFADHAKQIINEEREAGTLHRIRKAATRDYDIDAALMIANDRLATRIRYEAYAPYWQAHCREYKGRVWNDLIRMWWVPEHGQWEVEEDGWAKWYLGLAPTAEGIREQYEAEKKAQI